MENEQNDQVAPVTGSPSKFNSRVDENTGAYHFDVLDNEYKVRKLDYFAQAEVINLIADIGNDPLSQATIEAQKKLLPQLWVKASEGKWVALNTLQLIQQHINEVSVETGFKTFDVGLTLFFAEAETLTENFTASVSVKSPQLDLEAKPEPLSENQPSDRKQPLIFN